MGAPCFAPPATIEAQPAWRKGNWGRLSVSPAVRDLIGPDAYHDWPPIGDVFRSRGRRSTVPAWETHRRRLRFRQGRRARTPVRRQARGDPNGRLRDFGRGPAAARSPARLRRICSGLVNLSPLSTVGPRLVRRPPYGDRVGCRRLSGGRRRRRRRDPSRKNGRFRPGFVFRPIEAALARRFLFWTGDFRAAFDPFRRFLLKNRLGGEVRRWSAWLGQPLFAGRL